MFSWWHGLLAWTLLSVAAHFLLDDFTYHICSPPSSPSGDPSSPPKCSRLFSIRAIHTHLLRRSEVVTYTLGQTAASCLQSPSLCTTLQGMMWPFLSPSANSMTLSLKWIKQLWLYRNVFCSLSLIFGFGASLICSLNVKTEGGDFYPVSIGACCQCGAPLWPEGITQHSSICFHIPQ